MNAYIFILTAAALMISSFTATTEASAKSFRKNKPSWEHSKYYRLPQRQRDRLPIYYTRPPNARHYIHQDFPLWAARAFQGSDDR